jgi:hypothetical protein
LFKSWSKLNCNFLFSDFAFVSFVDVKNELLEEEVTIKEEVVENPLQESSSSTACTQTDRDERLQFKIDLDRLKSKICPRKQVSGTSVDPKKQSRVIFIL